MEQMDQLLVVCDVFDGTPTAGLSRIGVDVFYFESTFDEQLDNYTDIYRIWHADEAFVRAIRVRNEELKEWMATSPSKNAPPLGRERTDEIERKRDASGRPNLMRAEFVRADRDGVKWWSVTWSPVLV
jgi:hypothetical protein